VPGRGDANTRQPIYLAAPQDRVPRGTRRQLDVTTAKHISALIRAHSSRIDNLDGLKGSRAMKYFEVEVTRTVTERRKIYVSAESGDTAHDAAVENAEFGEVKAPWADPTVSYSTATTSEIERPARVDVAA
jgi:hypothetical protein